MSSPADLEFDPAEFSGKVRLFPLPNLVLFPRVLQPLHVFEPRYREMTEEALAGDRLIAMALFAPGWEKDYEGRPAVRPVACLGKIATYHRLEEGRYNILLVGVARVAIGRELPPTKSFRQSAARLLEDRYPKAGGASRSALRRQLIDAFRRQLPRLTSPSEQLEQLLNSDMSLGTLTDIVGYTLELDQEFKIALLGELDVDRRAKLLLEHLAEMDSPSAAAARSAPTFPPEFSQN